MYLIVQNYDGWLYNEDKDVFVSPNGRLAPKPGGRFIGMLSNEQFLAAIDEAASTSEELQLNPDGTFMVVATAYQKDEDMNIEEQLTDENLVSDEVVEVDDLVIRARTYDLGDNVIVNVVDIDGDGVDDVVSASVA